MSEQTFTISREIGIDMGHRIPDHRSKCRNFHGHRYKIIATCEGPLEEMGEETGMVMDFGFLKEEMMSTIDHECDHGLCLWVNDPWLNLFVEGYGRKADAEDDAMTYHIIQEAVKTAGYCFAFLGHPEQTKCYIVPFVPTAENLAKHWFDRLALRVNIRTNGRARLVKVQVWETPNCTASYSPDPLKARD